MTTLKYKTGEVFKIQVIVPSRAVKSAVKRNLIKRRTRDILSSFRDKIGEGTYKVFFSGSPLYKNLKQDISNDLKRIPRNFI